MSMDEHEWDETWCNHVSGAQCLAVLEEKHKKTSSVSECMMSFRIGHTAATTH
jgi:hypothetical protein